MEFSERYLYYRYGVTMSSSTNGDQVTAHYAAAYPALFMIVRNGTPHRAPVPGDVLSMSTLPSFNSGAGGHTVVVQSSSVNAAGNGTLTVVEENAVASGIQVLPVADWFVTYNGFPYLEWLTTVGAGALARRAAHGDGRGRDRERRRRGRNVAVHGDRDRSRPFAELSDGTTLPADLVVCSTGFTQGVPFLPADLEQRLLDERGNFLLYRQIRPVDVPGLYFNGYNSSFFSPLNAEMAAVWIAADLAGAIALPDAAAMRQAVTDQLAFMDVATDGHHCRGTKIIPFSMHNVDEVLGDLDLNISAGVRASHWLYPINPAAYRRITPTLLSCLAARTPSSPAPAAAAGLVPPTKEAQSSDETREPAETQASRMLS